MLTPPAGLEIYETRRIEPVRVQYGARQLPLGRPVLLVGLAPGVLPSSPLAAMLKREAQVLAELDHPNIVLLYDFKCDKDELWLVLEDAEGFALTELIQKGLSWRAVCAIGLDLSRALSHAHGAGQVHGKLHAGAVIITKSGRTKLAGFGRLPRSDDDQVEALEPTELGGLSPEASIGQPIGAPSDVFALGALLYELATATPPFGDPNDTQYPTRVRTVRQAPLLRLKGDFPQSLAALIEQCLHKNPSDRPPSADLLASQFAGFIGGATVPYLSAELARFGLVAGDFPSPPNPVSYGGLEPTARFRPLFWTIPAAVAGIILGLYVFQWIVPTVGAPERMGATAPIVDPEHALLLRVVATPWAHVLVDGVRRETTPFARPIALTPGKHVVRLEHPSASPEERIVEGPAGQVVLLNVQLHVERPPLAAPELSAPPEESTP